MGRLCGSARPDSPFGLESRIRVIVVYSPLAYHITFGTYGTRLHGDARGTVERARNVYGEPIVGRDGEWERIERGRLGFEPRVFTFEQMIIAEGLIPSICLRGG
jgi:hypothetical protein